MGHSEISNCGSWVKRGAFHWSRVHLRNRRVWLTFVDLSKEICMRYPNYLPGAQSRERVFRVWKGRGAMGWVQLPRERGFSQRRGPSPEKLHHYGWQRGSTLTKETKKEWQRCRMGKYWCKSQRWRRFQEGMSGLQCWRLQRDPDPGGERNALSCSALLWDCCEALQHSFWWHWGGSRVGGPRKGRCRTMLTSCGWPCTGYLAFFSLSPQSYVQILIAHYFFIFDD